MCTTQRVQSPGTSGYHKVCTLLGFFFFFQDPSACSKKRRCPHVGLTGRQEIALMCWAFVVAVLFDLLTLTQVSNLEKTSTELRKCLLQIGLWASSQGHFPHE